MAIHESVLSGVKGHSLELKHFPAVFQWLRNEIAASNDQGIEGVKNQRRLARTVVLQDVEGWPSGLIKSHDLSINHGFVWHR